jgi:hypothetical protein
MIIDGMLFFEPLTGTSVTASAASTNVLDLGVARDLGAGHGCDRPQVVVCALTAFTSAAHNTTLNIQVQGAPDNGAGSPGGYQTIYDCSPQYLGQLVAGQRLFQADLASISQPILKPVTTTFTCSANDNTITVASATGIKEGSPVYAPSHIVPGTTVTGISSTTITLSANTTAAAGSAQAISFFAQDPIPRYLRLNYVVANGPFTGGTLWGGIVLDSNTTLLYPSGFAFPAGT